jgi:hypothetical protein
LPNPPAPSPQQGPRHGLASAEFLRIPEMRPSTSEMQGAYDQSQPPTHSSPVPSMHFLAALPERPQPPTRLQSLCPTPFSTPPMPRKTLQFAVSPQSETKRTNSAGFGHSPGPSPSWEMTPLSQQSWQPPTAPTANKHAPRERDTTTSTPPTTTYVPQPPPSSHQAAAPHMQFGTERVETLIGPPRDSIRPVMTSTRKRAAVRSLSPQIRPLSHQEHPAPTAPQGSAEDPQWEARIQEAIRRAMLSMAPQGLPASQLPQVQPTAHIPLAAAALAEAEAAHIAQGLRLQEARRAHEQWALELARRVEAQAREHASTPHIQQTASF